MVAVHHWEPAPGPRPEEGHAVTWRTIRADDVDRLDRLFYRLSPETVYRRFFQPMHHPSRSRLEYLTAVDHDRREAVVALADDEIIAVARYDRHRDDPSVAEVAIVVEDGWQHRGVGTFLLRRLTELATARGVTTFDASVLADNRPAISFTRRLNPRSKLALDGAVVDVVAPIVPLRTRAPRAQGTAVMNTSSIS